MAKELGLNPRSLIKNIPSPRQQWKAPVKQWIRALYEEKIGNIPEGTRQGAQPRRSGSHAINDGSVPPHAYADEPALTENREDSAPATIADWQEYVDEWRDENEPPR